MTIEHDYIDRHPGSRRLAERAAAVLPNGVTHDSRYLRPFQVAVARAAGARKWDVDGNEYVDYVMGHGALLLGHNHPIVLDAAMAQLGRGTHYGASHELEVAWAEEVVRLVPSAEVVRFTSSGTEATLMALRLARTFTGRAALLKFDRHFHGWHDYVIVGSRYSGAAIPPGIPGPTLDTVIVTVPEIEAVRAAVTDRPDIGAIILEPAGAGSGTVPLPPRFLHDLRDLCTREGIVFIMDEVVTGFRWAPGGVQEAEGVVPDLTTLAKILAGGLPGGAVAGRRDIMEHLAFAAGGKGRAKVGHPGTFNANPLSASAGVACLNQMGDGALQAAASATAAQLRAGMNSVLCNLGIPGVVYGQASDLHVIVGGGAVPEAADYHPHQVSAGLIEQGTPGERLRLLQLAMLNRGVHLFGASGFVSAVHTEADIARTLEAWEGSLTALRDEGAL
jgi:glutamate-1-semialdehyde 2,1-aminomutase